MKRLLYLLLLLPSLVQAQAIHIVTVSDTVCSGSPAHFTATATGISSPHYRWKVNGAITGSDSLGFTTHTLSDGDSVKCLLINSAGNTVYSVSNIVLMTVEHVLSAGVIVGPDSVCEGAAITLTDSVVGGTWSAGNSNATVSDGIVTGVFGGGEGGPITDEIYYVVTNSCGSDSEFKIINIEPLPEAGINWGGPNDPDGVICAGQLYPINGGDGFDGNIFSQNGGINSDGENLIGVRAGKDILISISTNSCGSDTIRQNVEVMTVPSAVAIISTSSELCVGSFVTLTDSDRDFFPSWHLSNANAIRIFNGDTSDFTSHFAGANPGLDTITLTVSNQCGFANSSILIKIDPPGYIIGADSFCMGGLITLSDISFGGNWSLDNIAVATIDQSGFLNGMTEGSVLISYTLGSCTVTKEITINPLPSPIAGNDNLCIGLTTTLSDSSIGGRWYSSDSAVATIDNVGIVYGVNAGQSVITYTSGFGCDISKSITIHQLPRITGDKDVCVGYASGLSDSVSGGTWSSSDPNVAFVNVNSGIVYGVNAGTAIIAHFPAVGCSGNKEVYVSQCNNDMVVYPNPSKDEAVIYAYADVYHSYSFVNIIGQTVLQNSLDGAITVVNVQFLPAGVYSIELYGDNRKYVTRFVKE